MRGVAYRIRRRLSRTWHVFRQWPLMYRMEIIDGTVMVREPNALMDSCTITNRFVGKKLTKKERKELRRRAAIYVEPDSGSSNYYSVRVES